MGRPRIPLVAPLCALASVCGLLGVAQAASAARLVAPATVRVGGNLTAWGTGLEPGRYGLYLGVTIFHPRGGQSLDCVGRIGHTHRTTGATTFSGRLPRRLTCRFGAGEVERTIAVTPGRYRLLVASPSGSAVFNGSKSFVKRRIRVVAADR